MADRRRQNTSTQYNAMVASAATLYDMHPSSVTPVEWQNRAWGFFDTVGELWYAAQIYGAALGRARLVAAKKPKPGGEPDILKDGEAAEFVAAIAGSVAGQSQLMWNIGLLLTIPGIGVIVGHDNNEELSWNVYSPDSLKLDKVSRRSGQAEIKTVSVKTGPDKFTPLQGDTLTIPIWRQHPRRTWEPDSPARHTLDSLAEIELLSKHIMATGTQRLTANGLLLYPNQATFKPRADAADTKLDPFTQELVEAGQAALSAPGSAAAAFPLPVKVDKELIEYFTHLQFSTPFDEQVLALRESAIRRFATGMDLPAEQLLGMGDMTHWNAWQVSEDTIRIHIIPMLERIAHALTIGYLWPQMGIKPEDQSDIVVWVDTSDLTVRPDKSEDAFKLADRLEIGPKALLRETGFSDEDAPTPEELQVMIDKKLLSDPLVASEAANRLVTGREARNADGRQEAPYSTPESGIVGEPGPTSPNAEQTTPGNMSVLAEACDGLVYRALEKVGNRLRSATSKQREGNPHFDCPPTNMHCCLDAPVSFQQLNKLTEGLWNGRVDEVALRHNVPPEQLTLFLNQYVRRLVSEQHEYDFTDLATHLQSMRDTVSV